MAMEAGGCREGILLHAASSGRWGEAAPLPGWSRESLDDVARAIRSDGAEGIPSLRCAREMLEGADRWPMVHRRVPINALLQGTRDRVLERGHLAIARGCRCLKIKTRDLQPDEIVGTVAELAATSGGDVVFRLDPNRSWDAAFTMRVAEGLRGMRVEYLEEPVADAGALQVLIGECPVRIALDETLRVIDPGDLGRFAGASALVLKPMLVGGFARCGEFAEAGAALGMRAVVSGGYESGVGTAMLGRFAASLPVVAAAGLDTYSSLLEDVLCERLDFNDFVFRADEPVPDVDRSRLVAL